MKFRRIVSFVLLVSLLAAVLLPAAAIAEEPEKTSFTYVTLGASNTNGYGHRGYLKDQYYTDPSVRDDCSGYNQKAEDSYPVLLANYLEDIYGKGNVTHYQLAQSTMRVEELRYLIDPTYTADEYTRWRFYNEDKNSGWWAGNVDSYKEEYKEALSEADWITFDLGMNNFGVYLINGALNNCYDADFSHFMDEDFCETYAALQDKIDAMVTSVIGEETDMASLDRVVDFFTYALLGYCVNFDAVMKIIYELNPDVDITFVTVQNPMGGQVFTYNGIELPLGDLFGGFVDLANDYSMLLSPYADRLTVADVRLHDGRLTYFMDEMAEFTGEDSQITQDLKDCLDVYDDTINSFVRFRAAVWLLQSKGKSVVDTEGTVLSIDPWSPSEGTNLSNLMKSFTTAVETCKDKYLTEYTALTNALYKTWLSAYAAAARVETTEISALMSGDTETIENNIILKFFNTSATVCKEVADGKWETNQADIISDLCDYILQDDAYTAVSVFAFRTALGNTFFTHPNDKGHQECFEVIKAAYEENTTAADAMADVLLSAKEKYLTFATRYGVKYTVALVEALGEKLGVSEEMMQSIEEHLPEEDVIDYLVKCFGLKQEDVSTLQQLIQSTSLEFRHASLSNLLARLQAILQSVRKLFASWGQIKIAG